jgi:hypothetical protein
MIRLGAGHGKPPACASPLRHPIVAPTLTLGTVMIRRLASPSGLALHHILYAVLALGLAALIVMQLGRDNGSGNGEAATPSQLPPGAVDPTLMDPAHYRATIQQIEAILYKTEPAGLSDATQVSRLAVQLGTQVLRAPNRLQGQRLGREVMAFSNRIGLEEGAGYGTLDLAAARRDWENVRGKVFVPASWFRRAAP